MSCGFANITGDGSGTIASQMAGFFPVKTNDGMKKNAKQNDKGGTFHSKSRIIKSSKKLLVLMSSGKRGGNLFSISKEYYENLKQVRKSLKPAQSV